MLAPSPGRAAELAIVSVAGTGHRFAARRDQPLLDSALEAGIALPHQCRGASCGTCKCELIEGEVEHGWSLGLALTDEEKAAGLCLACQAMPRSASVTIRPLQSISAGAVSPIVEVGARVLANIPETPRVRRLVLALAEGARLVYRAGAYAELLLPGIEPARRYSFVSSDAGDGIVEFWVGRIAGGRASGVVHDRLVVGDPVGLRGPFGTCALPAGDGDVVALAGGTGLAPVVAILESELASGLSADVRLLFSVREHADVFGLDRLERLARRHRNFRYELSVTDGPSPHASHRELLPVLLPRVAPDLRRARVLISGAPGFVDACTDAAIALGARSETIASDRFVPVDSP